MEPSSDYESIPEPQIVAELSPPPQKNAVLRERKIWSLGNAEEIFHRFSPGERLILYILSIVLGISTLILVVGLNRAISVAVPASGGTFREGETTAARFINPILAISESDQDLTMLLFSGLMHVTPDGNFVPDLAASYMISADGTTYTFKLRPDATFHDGTPVTSDDVLFTVQLAQNPDIKSPRRADWEGVTATALDAHTIVFTLPHAYSPFIEDTTLGVLPKHLWQNVSPEEFPFSPLNTHPIGSGPYKVQSMKTDSTGATTRYDLAPFRHYGLGTPFISTISFLFYPNAESQMTAYENQEIDALSGVNATGLQALSRSGSAVVRSPLPRVYGVFLNQNHNKLLADASVRAALDAAVDKETLVKNVLGGLGNVLSGPIPPGILGNPAPAEPISATGRALISASTTPNPAFADNARETLRRGGWQFDTLQNTWTKKKDILSLKLLTADQPELVQTANEVAADWRAAGIQVTVQVYQLSEFNNTILRPREYDAVLFGEVVGREADLFAFWHSSQRNDPGLNLALYANSKADTLLTEARAATNRRERDRLYAQFAELVVKDDPAIFLYAPEFIYLVPRNVQGIQIGALTTAAERFLNIYQWYMGTEHVWSFFTDKTE